jgi:hypothetical protein
MQNSCNTNEPSVNNRIFKWLSELDEKIGMQTLGNNYVIVG